MKESSTRKDIKLIKIATWSLFGILTIGIVYNTLYTNIATKDCYHKAGEAMGGTYWLNGENGSTRAVQYTTYFQMCMNKEYGLS